MMSEKKERKYVECFKSDRVGSCNYCRTRSWNIGNKIYGQKQPNGQWFVCTDKKCYLEQGGKLTEFLTTITEPPDYNDWNLTANEILDLRKGIHLKFGDGADHIWFHKILPALNLFRCVKNEGYNHG